MISSKRLEVSLPGKSQTARTDDAKNTLWGMGSQGENTFPKMLLFSGKN
jgi:hypothetical protein